MTPQDALLASSPPRSGHKPKKRETPRACPLLDRPFLMLAREPCSARLRRVSSIPTARLTLKSAVCGLNGLLPTLRFGALHLNPRPSGQGRTLLRLRLFAPCSNENSRFRFGKKNCASLTFSLLNGIQRFRERRKKKRPHGSAETATAIQLND